MKTISKLIALSVFAVGLTSCNTFAPKPTETPTATATSVATLTSTPKPTNTPTQTPVPPTETPAAPELHMPSGKPSSNWNGIPIMPNALTGEGSSQGYSFTVNSSSDEIQKFYEKELGKLGWNALASGQGSSNSILMIFIKDLSTISVSIIPQPDGVMYVLLVK